MPSTSLLENSTGKEHTFCIS